MKLFENGLPEIFIDTQRLMHRYHMMQHDKSEEVFDPRRGQGKILFVLKNNDSMSQKALSELLEIRQQSLGELLRKLEQSGYITRTPSETDKRSMIVTLTEKGKQQEFERPDFAEVFSCLNEEEQQKMIEYLKRISGRLENLLADAFDYRRRLSNE